MPESATVYLGDAVFRYLTEIKTKDPAASQQMLQRFIRWYGKEKSLSTMTPWEVETFGQNSGADSPSKLAPIKDFLSHAHKQGITSVNLAVHLKAKRSPVRRQQVKRASTPTAQLSQEGHRRAKEDLESLKDQRLTVAEEIKRAMAHKDFRENAPLEAARDQQAHLEARIRELEQTLRYADIITENGEARSDKGRCRIGSQVVVRDLEDNEESTYVLVDPTEVNLAQGKISVESPVGKAFLNKAPGDVVEVNVPAGALKYKIEGVDGVPSRP
jgi:transcription elongation factor GreA